MNLKSILLSRCPRCRKGTLFVPGILGFVGVTPETCSNCGLRFMRESGYFLGAMYVSYGLGMLSVLPVAIFLAVVLKWSLPVILIIALLQTLISVPLFMRYSRVIWIHLDQAIDPR